jgi:hypothetical protein
MKYVCNQCFKNDPCILEFKKEGDNAPTLCPFEPGNEDVEWILVKEKIDKEKNK